MPAVRAILYSIVNSEEMKNSILDFRHIRGDIFGGLTAGIVALPLALAFGVQSGMGAIAGLYGAIALGIFAAIFGGTSTQISGPTGPMTVVSAVFIATAINTAGSLEAGLPIIIATFLLAGVLLIALGIIRIGQYVRYIPYPVVSGFMSGIGVIIIFLQIFPFFGHASPKTIPDIFVNIGIPLSDINWSAVGLALLTIAIIYLFPKITKAVPSTLIALLVVTLIPVFTGMDVPIIGDIPRGLPDLKLGEIAGLGLSDLNYIILPAITLAALGAIDSLLTSIVADNITKTKHNSNRELIGQGIGNMAAAAIGGIPGAGATMRTVVNVKSGGKTRISGVIHGLLLLAILLGAGKYAAEIPLSVLAGILITVGIGIIDYKGLRHIRKVPKADAAIMIIVLLVTVFVDLLQAVGIGMVMATVLFMKKMGDTSTEFTRIKSMKTLEKEEPWPDEKGIPTDIADQIFVKHLYGPLFFGFTSKFQELAKSLPTVQVVIFRMERVPFIDQSGLYALEDAIFGLREDNITVLITGLEQQPRQQMEKINLIPALVEKDKIFDSFTECRKWLLNNIHSGPEIGKLVLG